MNRDWLAGLGIVILYLLMVGRAAAQSDRGTIAGSVLDSTGAVVAGASITITGVDTGNTYKTVSTSEGVYRVADIQTGRYNITVQAPGFKVSQQHGVLIQISTTTALNITLEPGNVQEEVTVLADAPTLQTESSDIGTVVGDKQIHDLPLALNATGQSFVRSPETFVFLTPGTTGPGTNSDHASAGIYESKLSGGQNFGAEVLLDGVSTQRSDSGTAFDQTAPTVEALTEFKVTTSSPSAQYGHTSGGIESFTTKSGSNGYHGSIFELFRNEALDANPWSNDFANAKIEQTNVGCNPVTDNPPCTALNRKPRDRQNDFGGSLGGPVRIPHFYDGHDKTFFFFAWEQYRNRRTLANDIISLPNAAERSGDFSALLGPGLTDPTTSLPIINPCNNQQVRQGQIFDPSTTQVVGGQTCRLPFLNNKISNISPVAQKVLGYLPATNLAGSPANGVDGLLQNFQNPQALDHVLTTETSFRIDENVTNKNKMFFSYSSREQNYLNGNNVDLPAPLTPSNYYNYYFTHYLRYGWDYLASPHLLNSLTVGLNRVYTASRDLSVNGSDWDQTLGISGASGKTFPNMQFNGSQYGISYPQFGTGNYALQIPNSFVVADSVSWTKGRHSLRLGFEWRTYQYSVLSQSGDSPQYIFWNYQTSFAPGTQQSTASLTGDPFASFLLGLPNNEQVTTFSHYPRWDQNYYATYVQDDFKASRSLTLNLGLRWDVDTPRHEATGAQSVLSLTAANPLTPGQPGALLFGKSATGANTYYKDFGPRIGFAYAPNFMPKTVIRAGYSIYYAPLTYSDFGGNLTTGFSVNPNFISPDSFTPVSSFDAGFPAYPGPTQNPTLETFTSSSPSYAAPSWGAPGMVQNWDLEFQHEIAQDLILSIGYVGQHATRLRSNLAQINTMNPKYNYLGAALSDGVTSPAGQAVLAQLGVTVPSWFEPGWGPSGNDIVGQLLRPLPQYGNITSNCCLENLGQSTYNALEAKLERHFRSGLNLLASYTFSKTITDADSSFSTETGFNSNVFGAQNPYNLRGEKAVSYQDIPQTFVLSYVYELPVGPGKKYLTHGVASKVLGGWQVSGIQRYQTGSPTVINEYATTPPGILSPGNYRFSLIPGQSPFASHPVKWTPALDSTWNSGCNSTANGVFAPIVPGNPTSVNCAAYLDPSKGSLNAGGGYVYGNLPSVVSWWRSPAYKNEDFSIIKRTAIREGQAIMFKLDIPNAFNRHIFGAINGNPSGDAYFGVPGGDSHNVINAARTLQATLRYEF
ncbi:MAG: carboxypeptidase regulatory-like domain-containing protein [Candidatus Sulfotelmatobacter sp.]